MPRRRGRAKAAGLPVRAAEISFDNAFIFFRFLLFLLHIEYSKRMGGMKAVPFMALVFGALAVLATAGCSNTFNGVGQDMERAGRTIQDTF